MLWTGVGEGRLRAIPDDTLLHQLRQWRRRDDYPATALWGVVLWTIVLRHPTTEACLADLKRNVTYPTGYVA